jgi:FlgD Ig-like domain
MRSTSTVIVLSCLLLSASQSIARKVTPSVEQAPTERVSAASQNASAPGGPQALSGTGVIASWDFETDPDGWTSVDRTVQPRYFHIDNFVGVPGYTQIFGFKSLWCGANACATPGVDLCSYASLPGYGNNWNQVFQSTPFNLNGDVTVQYDINYDLEPSYDFAYFEYAGADNVWHTAHTFTGTGYAYPITDVISGANYTGPLRLRFRVKTDGALSDEDGQYPSSGAAEFDRVVVSQGTTVYCNETFEAEANQAFGTVDGIWSAVAPPPAGDYAGVFNGNSVLQEDIAYTDNTNLRGFFNGSPNNYACGSHPAQLVVPFGSYVEKLPKFVQNEIQSPAVSIAAYPATEPIVLGFDWYADLPLDNLVFIYYGVRSKVSGNWKKWRYGGTVYYNPSKSWLTFGKNLRTLIDSGATDIQVAIGAQDLCETWCGVNGTGNCHSHGPLIDNVRLTQANTATGTNVTVAPVDATTGTTPVTVTFSNVTGAGLTTLTTGASGPSLPAHFLLGNSLYYNLNTTTTSTGLITITINYNEAALTVPESTLRLLHWDKSLTPDGWVDITTSLSTVQNTIMGQTTSLSPFVIGAGSVTAVGDTPSTFALHQNIPNPFNPTTTITYDVAAGGARVSIAVFDASGRLVRTLLDEHRPAGTQAVDWDGRDSSGRPVSSGVYFYRMTSGSFSESKRMVLLK